jgi:hypothetical protein
MKTNGPNLFIAWQNTHRISSASSTRPQRMRRLLGDVGVEQKKEGEPKEGRFLFVGIDYQAQDSSPLMEW